MIKCKFCMKYKNKDFGKIVCYDNIDPHFKTLEEFKQSSQYKECLYQLKYGIEKPIQKQFYDPDFKLSIDEVERNMIIKEEI